MQLPEGQTNPNPQNPPSSTQPLSNSVTDQSLRDLISTGQISLDSKKMSTDVLDLFVKLKIDEATRALREEQGYLRNLKAMVAPPPSGSEQVEEYLYNELARKIGAGRKETQLLPAPKSILERVIDIAFNIGSHAIQKELGVGRYYAQMTFEPEPEEEILDDLDFGR